MLLSTGLPSQLRVIQFIASLLIVVVLINTTKLVRYHHLDRTGSLAIPSTSELAPEEQYLDKLREEHHFTNDTEWRACRIQQAEQSFAWVPSTPVRLNFQSFPPRTVDIWNPDGNDVKARARMELPVPKILRPSRMDPTDFLFGITTTYARVKDRDFHMLRSWSRWMTDGKRKTNGVTVAIFLDRARPGELREIRLALESFGIDAYVTNGKIPMSLAKRYFELAKTLKAFSAVLSNVGVKKKWYALVEDTVFFPSISHLRERLSRYDTDSDLYIGMPSERADWTQEGDAVTTYGGGALFFSRSALAEIVKLPCFASDGHDLPFRSKSWDVLFQECATKHTILEMRVLPGFYSPNDHIINDNPEMLSSESGSRPLILHDYAERHGVDVHMAHTVTEICGEACFMQRFVFRDNWVLVNGLSLTHYPDGLKADNTIEHPSNVTHGTKLRTFPSQLVVDDDDSERTHFGWKGRRETWTLLDSTTDTDGMVWQAYIRRAAATKDHSQDMDSVIVLVWENLTREEL